MNANMAAEKVSLINQAIKTVKECAKLSQKLSHTKHIEEQYSLALGHLDIYRTNADVLLKRFELIGK